MAARRAVAERVDGILALDKPAGWSSNTALQHARRLLGAAKAGHTGTLDPLASGLLPLTFGEATKFAADLLEAEKAYEATIVLGRVTATGDAEGVIIEERPVAVTRAQFEATLARFVGAQLQVPPMHSALKRDGRPLYLLARQGLEVERAARHIHIASLHLVHWDDAGPRIALVCSKGTYVRVLAQDIGAALGCGAHLGALRRTRVGPLVLRDAIAFDTLAGLDLSARRARLLALDALLSSLPRCQLDAPSSRQFSHGQRVFQPGHAGAGARLRVYDAAGALLGLARCRDAWLEPVRLLDRRTATSAAASAGSPLTTNCSEEAP